MEITLLEPAVLGDPGGGAEDAGAGEQRTQHKAHTQ